jgi:Fic family protein
MQEKRYTIEAPPPATTRSASEILGDSGVREAVTQAQERYMAWQEFRHRSWVPAPKENTWAVVQLIRKMAMEPTPIVDEKGQRFTFDPKAQAEFLHQVDLELGGMFLGIEYFTEGDRRSILHRNLIEESIASSQLEGANTSRATAKRMLAEGRAPKSKGEHMIVNNHEVMVWIEEELKNEKLSKDLLLELHRRITRNTISENHQGSLRNTLDDAGNPLVVKPWDDSVIAYTTPKREFVEEHLPRLIGFANDDHKWPIFIHPLIKSIMLHFWIGLLHPFEDGNGRLARILFYWYMLRRKYWAFAYLSISERILKSPKQYAMAYIYSEQDSNDLNYFIHYNVAKIKLARRGLEEYVRNKIAESKRTSEALQKVYGLNRRQTNLLQYLVKDEQRHTSLKAHMNVNRGIGKVTAATDLRRLVESGFLKKARSGRNIYYYPTELVREYLT